MGASSWLFYFCILILARYKNENSLTTVAVMEKLPLQTMSSFIHKEFCSYVGREKNK